MKAFAFVVALALTLVAGSARAAEDFSGKWSGTFTGTSPDGSPMNEQVFMDLKHAGASLTGTAGPTAETQHPLSNGKVDGNNVAFDVSNDGIVLKFTLVFAAGHLKGDVAAEFGGQKLTAKIDAQRKTGF